MIRKIIISSSLFSILFFTCKKKSTTSSNTYDCTGVTPTYTTNIKSIMDDNCATSGCHSSSFKASGYDLSSYAGTKSASASKNFMGSMQHESGYKAMPQGGSKLSDANLKLLYCWIQNGTPQ